MSNSTARTAAPAAVAGTEENIPIGAVMDWWRPTESTPLPVGFMLCDGSQVVADYSPIHGKTLPDLDKLLLWQGEVNENRIERLERDNGITLVENLAQVDQTDA